MGPQLVKHFNGGEWRKTNFFFLSRLNRASNRTHVHLKDKLILLTWNDPFFVLLKTQNQGGWSTREERERSVLVFLFTPVPPHLSVQRGGPACSARSRNDVIPPGAGLVLVLLLVVGGQEGHGGQVLVLGADAAHDPQPVDLAVDPRAPALLDGDLHVAVVLRDGSEEQAETPTGRC